MLLHTAQYYVYFIIFYIKQENKTLLTVIYYFTCDLFVVGIFAIEEIHVSRETHISTTHADMRGAINNLE